MADPILVTGGTGKTGSIVADRLRAAGQAVRVGTRRPTAPDHVRFDWGDADSIAPALDGVQAVYLVAPSDRTDHLAAMRPLLERAAARDIRLVLLSASSLRAGDPMMGEVHAWLKANAPRWSVLRPSWFMQNFLTQHLPGILADGAIYSATEDGSIAFIDAADIAAVAAAALTGKAGPNGDHVLTGPAALGYDAVAVLLSHLTGRTVRHDRLSVAALAKRYESLGLPAGYARLLAGMDLPIADGAEDRTTDVVERITGRPPRRLEAFLRCHADRFTTCLRRRSEHG